MILRKLIGKGCVECIDRWDSYGTRGKEPVSVGIGLGMIGLKDGLAFAGIMPKTLHCHPAGFPIEKLIILVPKVVQKEIQRVIHGRNVRLTSDIIFRRPHHQVDGRQYVL